MRAQGDQRLTRRDFVKSGTIGAALLAGRGIFAASEPGAPPKKKRPRKKRVRRVPVGLQLYSVRKDCEKDLPGVLKAVGEMGYKGVEFAGYYGRSAKELRTMLD